MKNKTVGVIGIILFAFAMVLIIAKYFENDFLNKLSEYRKYFAILGGGFIGVGFFGKNKKNKNND